MVDLAEILLAKRIVWNIDINLKLVVGGTEIGAITGKIEYAPTDSGEIAK